MIKMSIPRHAAKWLGCGALVAAVAGCSTHQAPAQVPPQAATPLAQEPSAQRAATARNDRNDADTTVHFSEEILRACQLPSTPENAPHFDFDDSKLHARGVDVLDQVAKCVRDGNLRGRVITIIGHTDPRGSSASNQELSANRAEAARDYLVEHGAASQNLRVLVRGESEAR